MNPKRDPGAGKEYARCSQYYFVSKNKNFRIFRERVQTQPVIKYRKIQCACPQQNKRHSGGNEFTVFFVTKAEKYYRHRKRDDTHQKKTDGNSGTHKFA